MPSLRHTAPMYVDVHNKVRSLTRVTLGQTPGEDGNRREAFIQNLVHDHPALIPMAEIEPAFSPLISVCMELPTPAGYLDNLWITPWGGLVLGEAKLVRNPQARREVVAQALDYARAITSWSYDNLQDAVRLAIKQPSFTLWSLVEADSDLDEGQFVDAVQRRLTASRLMLLIIGDGIQEGVEALTAHLQLHAGLHVGLALVDLSLWRDVDGGMMVMPRVPMRTVLIERGIVRIEAQGVRIDPPALIGQMPPSQMKPRAVTASEGEFFDHMAIKRPELVEPVKAALAELVGQGIRPEIGRTLQLRFAPTPDTSASAGYIESNGKLWTQGVASAAIRLGLPSTAEAYQATVANLIGGQVRRYEKSPPEVIGIDGRGSDIAVLLQRQKEWVAAVAALIEGLTPSG